MCSATEDSDATVCGEEEEEEEGARSPSLMGTGANAGLPGYEQRKLYQLIKQNVIKRISRAIKLCQSTCQATCLRKSRARSAFGLIEAGQG